MARGARNNKNRDKDIKKTSEEKEVTGAIYSFSDRGKKRGK